MNVRDDLIAHFRRVRPALDSDDRFMFFSNNKVAQVSILRNLLKRRALIYKDDPERYWRHFESRCLGNLDSIYKFTFVRNPWSRVVSAFFYLRAKPGSSLDIAAMSFEEFVTKLLANRGPDLDPHLELQSPRAYLGGRCFVDFVGRFETLEADWATVARTISDSKQLPHENRTSHGPYSQYYTPHAVEVVGKLYRADIELFGYEFGS